MVFADAAREACDAAIFATGYNLRFPFLDPTLVPWVGAHSVPRYRKMIPAAVDNLCFIGLFQPLGCIWPLADYQARIASMLPDPTTAMWEPACRRQAPHGAHRPLRQCDRLQSLP